MWMDTSSSIFPVDNPASLLCTCNESDRRQPNRTISTFHLRLASPMAKLRSDLVLSPCNIVAVLVPADVHPLPVCRHLKHKAWDFNEPRWSVRCDCGKIEVGEVRRTFLALDLLRYRWIWTGVGEPVLLKRTIAHECTLLGGFVVLW